MNAARGSWVGTPPMSLLYKISYSAQLKKKCANEDYRWGKVGLTFNIDLRRTSVKYVTKQYRQIDSGEENAIANIMRNRW